MISPAHDANGQIHAGRRIDYPVHLRALHDVEQERWFGTYQPDIYARDEVGELLIEIRVTHAVDDCKAARVQAHGRRMVEIDLSGLDRDTPPAAVGCDRKAGHPTQMPLASRQAASQPLEPMPERPDRVGISPCEKPKPRMSRYQGGCA